MLPILLTLIDDKNTEHLFENLFNEYKNDMTAIAEAILENHMDAEEAVMDVFIYLSVNTDKIPDFEAQTRKTKSYMLTAARYSACKKYRDRRRKRGHILLVDSDEYLASLSSFERENGDTEKFSDQELYQELRKFICSMPIEYRRVLTLRFVYEKSIKNIAKILGIPKGTASTRLYRAIDMLKDRFDVVTENDTKERQGDTNG